jgi:hypothetical protein
MERRGVVYIAPTAHYLPPGRLVDPERSSFEVHWECPDVAEVLADAGVIAGATEAIRWGRERCDRVLTRLAHTSESHYSAGEVPLTENADGTGRRFPIWPPIQRPREGWWTPEDEEAAWEQAVEDARRSQPRLPDGEPPPGPWTGGY